MGVLMKTHHFSTALSTSLGKPNRFPSPAKLNLFLYINGKLPNGYHELQTLFQFLDFGDWLTIDIRQDKQIHITPEIKTTSAPLSAGVGSSPAKPSTFTARSEEHTSELQSH